MSNTDPRTNNNSKNNLQPTPLTEYIPIIWRGKWIILIFTLIAVNIALYLSWGEEPVYQAHATVLINTSGQTASSLGGLLGRETINIGNELEVLRSRRIAETVAERLTEKRYLDENTSEPLPILTRYDVERDELTWLPLRSVTGRVRGAVSFEPKRDADVITITARSKNNREAALIANTFAEVYYSQNLSQRRQQSRSAREFLERQMASKRSKLEEIERQYQAFMERRGVINLDQETRQVIQQVSELEAQREATEVDIKSMSNTLASLHRQLEEEEPKVAQSISSADNAYIRMIQEQIAELEVERDLTLTQNPEARTDERYERMINDIDNQLGVLRDNLRRRTQDYMLSITPGGRGEPAGFVQELKQRILEQEIQLQGLEFRRNAIDESLDRYEARLEQLPQVNMDYARMQRARSSAEQVYLMLEERYNEAIISEQSEFGNVSLIDEAQVPGSPGGLGMKINLVMGLMLGLGAGVLFVIGREQLLGPVRIPEDLRKKGYVILSAISTMDNEIKKISKRGFIVKKGNKIDTHLVMLSNPLSPSAESFRLIHTKLQYIQSNEKYKTFLFASPNPGEGKTTVTANLGVSYAKAGKKVLLIEGDLRKPALVSLFDQVSEPGLTEVLADEMPINYAIQKTVVENLNILAGGALPENPAELLGSKKMATLLHILSGHYDIILIDSPPVLAASDALKLSAIVDAVIMVARSDRTRIKELEYVQEQMRDVGSHITGVVLNFFDYRNAYGSSYAYNYRYGKYGKSHNGKDAGKLKKVKVD